MSGAGVAFYAPMKAPGHPVPSGDREIARATLAALGAAGFAAEVVSELRVLDLEGDGAAQARLGAAAAAEAARLAARAPARLWFTYHCHYKAPDLIGPVVARAWGVPYVVSEPSTSPKRRHGPWAGFAAASDAALAAADLLLWSTARDAPGLAAAGWGARMRHLAPWVDPGPEVAPRGAGDPLALVTVAMMRPGDKLESYRRLAAALALLPGRWRLEVIGDGAARAEVAGMFAPFGDAVVWRGALPAGAAVRAALERADLMVWPGVGEGVGLAWLEAQAAGVPVVAEDGPAARAVIGAGRLVTPGDAPGFAAAITAAAAERTALSARARAHVLAAHSPQAAARTLGTALGEVLA